LPQNGNNDQHQEIGCFCFRECSMNPHLEQDLHNFSSLLSRTSLEAQKVLAEIDSRPSFKTASAFVADTLPEHGLGAQATLDLFLEKYAQQMTGSAGARYLGFVTGGATPASLMGDWLCSVFDNNAADPVSSITPQLERVTLAMLRDLFGLSEAHSGAFVSGATMSSFVGLAQARQWFGHQFGVNVAQDGLFNLPNFKIFSATPHSSIFKALSMLGMGRGNLELVPTLPDREAIDPIALRIALERHGQPCVVVANSGTVNTVDFDALEAINALKKEFPFWLHVDAAFGGFAAISPKFSSVVAGLDAADSITIDAHKWLNVPYDSAMQFSRHQKLQLEVFQNTGAAYLGAISDNPEFVHLTPENSRRFRALPAWFTLLAYGREGHAEIVERNVNLARVLGERIKTSSDFKLLAPVRMNVVCFTLAESDQTQITAFLKRVRDEGKVFLTPTNYKGTPAIRAAFSNWRTTSLDLELIWDSLTRAVNS
jgi:glutamate/tyrosine decarboxylase-like PLP-dependent enzyme